MITVAVRVGMIWDKRTFCDVVVHRIDNDGNFGSRHVGVGLRGCYWREYWCFCDGSSGVGSWGRI